MKHCIGIISPYKKLADLAKEVSKEFEDDIIIGIGDIDEAMRVANDMISKGVEVIISRGGTALFLRKYINVPVVEISISAFDVLRAVKKAANIGKRVGIFGVENVISDIASIKQILDVDIYPVIFHKYDSIEVRRKEIEKVYKNIDVAVGDSIAIEVINALGGVKGILIESEKNSIVASIKEAKRIIELTRKERQRIEELSAILNFSYEGIISTDEQGLIKYFNPAAEKILQKDSVEVMGKRIIAAVPEFNYAKLIENSKTKLEEFIHLVNKTIMVNVIPINSQGRFEGAVFIFQDTSKIQKVEEKVRTKLYSKGHTAKYDYTQIITENKTMADIVNKAKQYAATSSTILITGETGTGKEIFAQSIHNASKRKNNNFVAVNCAAIAESLLESELFGYDEGAFTGAKKGGKMGYFELAHHGTIFLDEIGEISPKIQKQLLRVIEEREIMRVGGDKVIPVDVRIIAATNKDLSQEIEAGRFRGDLYFRLNVLTINLPPLRERKGCIPLFTDMFIKKFCSENGLEYKSITEEALNKLAQYEWPGNIRELENTIERLVISTQGEFIDYHDVLSIGTGNLAFKESSHDLQIPFEGTLQDMENMIISKAIEISDGDQSAAAKLLGIGRTTLWRWINKNNKFSN